MQREYESCHTYDETCHTYEWGTPHICMSHATYTDESYWVILQCVAVCCSVLQRVAVRYSMLHFLAVCCSTDESYHTYEWALHIWMSRITRISNTYTHTHTHTLTHTHTHTQMYKWDVEAMHIHKHTHIHTRTHTHTHTQMYRWDVEAMHDLFVYIYVHTYDYIYIYLYIHLHMFINTYIYKQIHT